MPRKTRRPPPFLLTPPSAAGRPSQFPLWLGYLLTALLAAALGAGGMFLALRPKLAKIADLQAALTANASAPSGPATAVGVPPLSLTAGLDPAHAALNLGNWYEDQAGQAQNAGNSALASVAYARSIANYSLAIADGLDNPDIRTDLGVAYYKSGSPQKALTQYQDAQKQNPAHENSLFNQGAAYAVLGQTPKALTAWQAYLRRFPHGQHVADAQQLISEVQAHGSPNSSGATAPSMP